jgi:hypothetical protein
MAEAASDLLEKTDFLEIEKTWLSLARDPELWARRRSNSEPSPVLEVWSGDFQASSIRPKSWSKANCPDIGGRRADDHDGTL